MGTRDGIWDGDNLLWCAVEQAAWAGIPAPASVRAIMVAWSEPGDAASLLPRERDPAILLACYRDIAAARAPTRFALALLWENARLNAEYGLWTDLRREARLVLAWLAPLTASGALQTLPAEEP